MVTWHHLDAHDWAQAASQHGAEAGIRAALARIEELNPQHRAFILVLADEALAAARALDALPASERGPLHGVPVAIKDENDVAGTVTTFGTTCNHTPKTADSLTVSRLRQAGAVIIGKTAMPAFGAFPITSSEAFGITPNPHNLAFAPGGSSGGSAAAVATGMVPLALGGDGGGSVRIPADRCGVVGFKPARGAVSTAPYNDLWQDLGTSGPLARSVRDARLMYQVISGTYSPAEDGGAQQAGQPASLRIGINPLPASPLARLHPEHRKALWQAAQALTAAGHTVTYLDKPTPDPTLPFATQFLAGLCDEIKALEDPSTLEALHRHTLALGFWARGPILQAAKDAGRRLGATLEEGWFQDYDLILTPTTANRPPKADQLQRAGGGALGFIRAMAQAVPSVVYTLPWNVSGHPALALPAGTASDGLPLSVQLVAPFRDTSLATLFGVAGQLQQVLPATPSLLGTNPQAPWAA